jgi:hypothetical protein
LRTGGVTPAIQVAVTIYKVFIGKSDGKKPFGTPSSRNEDNIETET